MIHKNDFSKIETSFDTRYNYNGKNFNIYIKYNNKDTSIASININNTFNKPGYTTIWKKEYGGRLTDDMIDYIISQVNKELKTNIIPMLNSSLL